MHVLDLSPINLPDCASLETRWSTGYQQVRRPQILLVLPQAPYLVILSTPQFIRGSTLVLRHPLRFSEQLRGAKRIKVDWIMQHMERHA